MNNTDGKKYSRAFLNFNEGNYVKHKKEVYKVLRVLKQEEIIGIHVQTNEAVSIPINELEPVGTFFDNGFVNRDLDDLSDKDWKKLKKRIKIIKPLLENSSKKSLTKKIKKRAKKFNMHFTTLYRWIERYRSTSNVLSLLPRQPGVSIGFSKLELERENIITTVLENHYLTSQKPSASYIHKLIDIECKKQGLITPGYRTVLRRINNIPGMIKASRQGMRSLAKSKYEPAPGELVPDYPLHIVQIDHTKVDLIIVDDVLRQTIGRPWITVAIDVYSRMITGFYLSLDAPSGVSVAMCIGHSINPKTEWLKKHNIDERYPVFGCMTKILVDNGSDFRAGTLKDSCNAYNIDLEFRPVNKTNYGGHIERLIGTLMKEVHSIPGTTFSNTKERLEYNSENEAVMTFSELEEWLAIYITRVYHQSIHRGIGTSPIKRWDLGMTAPGSAGYPDKPVDEERIYIDFLPAIKRTIQKTGVNIDGINYYSHDLRLYINEKDINTNKNKKYLFRRDYRDLTYIWFYEKSTQIYYKIPSAKLYSSLNLWDLRAAKKQLKLQNEDINEENILSALEKMHNIVDNAKVATKKARRKTQQKKVHSGSKIKQKITTVTPLSEDTEDDEIYSDKFDKNPWDEDDWN